MDVQAIINQVKLEMYGADVGEQVNGVYGHSKAVKPVVVLEKIDCGNHQFSYLVKGVEDPNYIGHAVGYKDGTVLIDNARIIGSGDPQFCVANFDQARREVMQTL